MRYTVIWKPTAERQLTRIWLDAEDRNAVRAAADEVDHQLADNPSEVGESRSGTLRVVFHGPLLISFHARHEDRLVYVVRVCRIRSR
jgi:plasmid stabilization system protein ParE